MSKSGFGRQLLQALARDYPAATPSPKTVAVIREFIVDSAGEDLGDVMTVQAQELAGKLAAAGVLKEWV